MGEDKRAASGSASSGSLENKLIGLLVLLAGRCSFVVALSKSSRGLLSSLLKGTVQRGKGCRKGKVGRV